MKFFTQLRELLASVHLAIFTLCILAVSSIIGTIIPQGESGVFYIKQFGPKLARFMQVLDIPNMYTSWWFLGLLGLLALNLIVCSIERFPLAWRLIHQDPLSLSEKRLAAMKGGCQWHTATACPPADIAAALEKAGWKGEFRAEKKKTIFAAQKGRWSRLGVYLVHLSILVIFLGALVGYFAGFRASVMIPEGKGTSTVYTLTGQQPVKLDFTVHCNAFLIDFYHTGMPKEYRSSLSIVENNEVVSRRDIMVNSPFTYKGITFYQASYQGYQDFLVTISENNGGERQTFQLPFRKQAQWREQAVQFGIVKIEHEGMRVLREKLWVKIGTHPAQQIWLDDNSTAALSAGEKIFTIKVKQLYATGLQVTKDPGVWLVYLGCLLMLAGLYMAFFMSHKRLWLCLIPEDGTTRLLLAGNSNKNRQAMVQETNRLQAILQTLYPPLSR